MNRPSPAILARLACPAVLPNPVCLLAGPQRLASGKEVLRRSLDNLRSLWG